MYDTSQHEYQAPDVGGDRDQRRTSNEPGRFRKRPIEIYAIQFDGTNHVAISAFAPGCFEAVNPEDRGDDPDITAQVWDYLHGTWVGVKDGQWIAQGIRGEFYPIADDVMGETYEAVSNG